MKPFRRIGLMGSKKNASIANTLWQLQDCLLKNNVEVILEKNIAHLIPNHRLHIQPRHQLAQYCDLIIVIGGDGSMLSAARCLAGTNIPVLGINRGQFGFLTDIASDALYQQIYDVLNGEYWIEPRYLLALNIFKNKELIHSASALNEIVLHSDKMTKMIAFELFVDQHFVMIQKSDGLIISTPTGSTAYALSAGGPIMHPSLNALALIPMYPHTLSNRPMVIDGSSEITIHIKQDVSLPAQISCDSHIHYPVSSEEVLLIRKQTSTLLLLHPTHYNYYEVCRKKLGWGSSLKSEHHSL
ncbi:MAG: NAD(+) kinase [Endozoicomonadaceae bacterium]|nr:NAD(+) kinase [Endozoicomonadaceae bacterium]